MRLHQQLELYRAMFTARKVDELELELTNRGEAFFHVSGAGHEGSAALARHLIGDDWLHCHYRDKALMIARGIEPRSFFEALLCKDTSHSRGRQMSAHMSDPSRNVLSIVGPVGNSALQAVGVAAAVKEKRTSPIVLCSMGDGTTQQGEFLEACAEAVRSELPVLFLVEDNRLAISTSTNGKTFFSLPDGPASELFGMPIHHIDGRDVLDADAQLQEVVADMRRTRRPAVVVLNFDRLTSHTNADDHTLYRDEDEIRRVAETGDPVRIFRSHLAPQVSEDELRELEEEVTLQVAQAEAEAADGADPTATMTASVPLPSHLKRPSAEYRGRDEVAELTMKEAMRAVLGHQLQNDDRVVLFGEDIEDGKGDVFGVTKGLSTQFPGRVSNSALTESTIVGTGIGQALAGKLPVAFLQFADFLPLAFNQIASELGTMHWRTDGGWQAPMIVMIACGAYRPGLGPFHAQTFESIAAHTPGVDVMMPSNAADAAGLLNAAFQSGRPTLFFYPKSCLNDVEAMTSSDVQDQLVPIGHARLDQEGDDLTIVTWGNTIRLCRDVAESLTQAGVGVDLIDLRTLSPWDEAKVKASVEKTGRLMVVHEDNRTCGLGGEIVATIAEQVSTPVISRRVTRPDTYVPCNFANQIDVLPSFKRILTTAAEMLDLELSWDVARVEDADVAYVEAIGSGPSDESVELIELRVQVGDRIERGDEVAELEATKSVFELTSSVAGTVVEVLASEGDTVDVGAPLLKVSLDADGRRKKPVTQERPGTPILSRREPKSAEHVRIESIDDRGVGMSLVSVEEGSRVVTNEDIIRLHHDHLESVSLAVDDVDCPSAGYSSTTGSTCVAEPQTVTRFTAADIVQLTGIHQRCWAADGESTVSLASSAGRRLLAEEQLTVDDVDLLICTTTSPASVTPSTAYQVLAELATDGRAPTLPAYDMAAACSGYLYALQSAYDFLRSTPSGRVMVVTTEVLSPLMDPADLDTFILFGDAASATMLYGANHMHRARARLRRPVTSGKVDVDKNLSVPLLHDGYMRMKGKRVFSEAVRSMASVLGEACQQDGLQSSDLNLIVPHQANQRIIDAVQSRVDGPVFSNIRHHGNTASSSIPLCLNELLPLSDQGDRLGLAAFGGGYTFGAAVVEAV